MYVHVHYSIHYLLNMVALGSMQHLAYTTTVCTPIMAHISILYALRLNSSLKQSPKCATTLYL